MKLRPITSAAILILLATGGYLYTHPNTVNYLLQTKDAALSDMQNAIPNIVRPAAIATTTASSTKPLAQKKSVTPKPIAMQTPTQVVTPSPLQVKKILGIETNSSGSITVSGVIARTNFERTRNGVAGLTESAELDASAQFKAQDMLNKQYFEHTAPDGKTVGDLVDAQGYEYLRVGENLALGDFSDNVDLVTAWMNSPGHRANLLDSKYQNIGIGVAYGMYNGRYVVFAVQHFGRPKSTCPVVEAPLKLQIEQMQSQSTQLSAALDVLKAHIDEMRAKGEYVENSVIDAYNNSVNEYEALIKKTNSMRDTYNAEVKAFNACLAAM